MEAEIKEMSTQYLEGFVQGYLGVLNPNLRFDYDKSNPVDSLQVIDDSGIFSEEYLEGYKNGMKNEAVSPGENWIDARQKASLKNKGYMRELEENER